MDDIISLKIVMDETSWKAWKNNQNDVMDEKLVQNGVIDGNFVKNFVMDPGIVRDLSI